MTAVDSTLDVAAMAAAQLARLERAWNGADGRAYGEAFRPDAEFVDVRGGHHRGAASIAGGHQGLFDSIYAGSAVAYHLDSARVVAPGCVVAIGGATMQAPVGPMRGTHHSRLTAVITEDRNGWSIASFHNTLVSDGR